MRSLVGILGCCQVPCRGGRPIMGPCPIQPLQSPWPLQLPTCAFIQATIESHCVMPVQSSCARLCGGAVQPLLAAGLKGSKLGCLTHPRARTCGGARP